VTFRNSLIFSLSRTLRGPSASTGFAIRDRNYKLSKTGNMVRFENRSETGSFEKIVSISTPEVNVYLKPDFFEYPYFITFDYPLLVYPNSVMKVYAAVPFRLNLMLKGIATGFNKLESENAVDKYCVTNEVILDRQLTHSRKKAWQGAVNQGTFCTLVRTPAYNIGGPFPKHDLKALVPLYIASHYVEPVEVSNIIIDAESLEGHLSGDILFTNIVHVNLISANEAKAYVTSKTVKRHYQKVFPARQSGGKRLLRDFFVRMEKGGEYEF